jgi:superfamily II DNA/RNA helicase
VRHVAYDVLPPQKKALLVYLLRRRGSLRGSRTLVYVRTQQRCERLAEQLRADGFDVVTVHGVRE